MSTDKSTTNPIQSNVPEFSVSELAFSLKKTLEENFGRVRVRGELSRVSIAASGHMYSSIKDDQAVIDSVCWKGTMAKLSIRPEEGLEVICTGRISTYPQRSNYQLIIESMELAGEGALLKMLEERKKKLAAEGLFDPARKREIPFLPQTIGVITSPTGAVIRDILHRLSDRFPRHVILWPALVQGENAAAQITAAIEGFQSIHERGFPRPDVLIVARGGGSLEDLMPFNEENVVRAAAASTIPLISAVGHETDTTLIDFAADLRAPTPTGAAEMAVPVRANLMAQVLDDEKRLLSAITRQLSERGHRLDAQSKGLGDPTKLLEIKAQKFDHIADRTGRAYREYLGQKQSRLIEIASRIIRPEERLKYAAQNLNRWGEQLSARAPKITADKEKQLSHAGQMLEAYGFENVLKRGFAVIRSASGDLITSAKTAAQQSTVQIQFKDQKFVSAAIGQNKTPPKKPTKKPAKKASTKNKDNGQASLF